MDEKQHAKETKQFKDETTKYRAEMQSRDRATFSEANTREYDHKTGTLKERKKK